MDSRSRDTLRWCAVGMQWDGMSFLDYKKKTPDTSRLTHKYQEYQLRERAAEG